MAWAPQVGFQSQALAACKIVDEMFLGGDRGGGKSACLLADFAQHVKLGRGWKGVLFRRTTDEFETLIERSKDVYLDLFPGARFYEDSMTWKFPGGATLQFHHMHRDSSVDAFVGREYVWIGFDELPQWPKTGPYLKMLATVRTSDKNIPCRVRSTGNPGGPGIGWIKQRFHIDEKNVRGSSHRLIRDPRTGLTRMFILSLYAENKIHQQADPNYRNRVMAAVEGDPELERAWIYADFSALFGQYFRIFDKDIHRVDPVVLLHQYGGAFPLLWRVEAGLDYGETSPTTFQLWVTSPEGISYLCAEYYDAGEYPSQHAAACEDLYRSCPYTKGRKPDRVWADSQIFYTRTAAQHGQLDKRVSDVFRRQAGLNVVPSNKNRMAGWRHLKELMAWKKNDAGAFIRKPQLYYFPECVNLEREMQDAVHSETGNREDVDAGCSDHGLDAARYWAMGARKGLTVNTQREAQRKADGTMMTFSATMRQIKHQKMGIITRGAPYIEVPAPKAPNIEEALVRYGT